MLEMLTWLSGPEFYGSISMSEKGNSAMQLVLRAMKSEGILGSLPQGYRPERIMA